MKAALRGSAAHYNLFINITLVEAPNQDPLTGEKLPVDTLIPAWSAAQNLFHIISQC